MHWTHAHYYDWMWCCCLNRTQHIHACCSDWTEFIFVIELCTLDSRSTFNHFLRICFRSFNTASHSGPYFLATLIQIDSCSFDTLDSYGAFFFFCFWKNMDHTPWSVKPLFDSMMRQFHPRSSYRVFNVWNKKKKENYICIYFKKSHDMRI